MPDPVIEVEGLVKTYGFRETTLAVDHASFTVPNGARFGLLGANGAGKSTVLRILATVLRPTEGIVRVGGHDAVAEPAEVRKLVSYMPQDLDLRGWRSGSAYLHFWARVSGLPAEARRDRIRALVDFLEFGAEIDGDPASYTIDVQKRLSLGQALISNQEVLLLDEPITGLGDVGRRFVIERLERLTAQGKTVVLSSPLVTDIRATCDQVAVMSDGHLATVSGVRELLEKIGEGRDARIFIDCDGLSPEAVAALKRLNGVMEVRSAPTATIVYVTPVAVEMAAIRDTLEAHGVRVRDIREAQLKLGDVFSALQT